MIYVLSKPNQEKLTSINIAASELNYNVLTINGEKSFEIETIFSELESHIGRILKKIKENEFNLTKTEWEHLLYYASFLFCNSKNTRDKINRYELQISEYILKLISKDKTQFKNLLNKVYIEKPHLKGIDIDEFSKTLNKEGTNNLTLSQNSLIYKGLGMSSHIYLVLSKLNWAFYKLIDDSNFVTSDIPIIALNENQSLNFCLGFENAGIVQFPLTKKICLIGNWLGLDTNKELTGEFANAVNAMTLRWSFNEIYSPLSLESLNTQFKNFG